jgi:hypothetical protein
MAPTGRARLEACFVQSGAKRNGRHLIVQLKLYIKYYSLRHLAMINRVMSCSSFLVHVPDVQHVRDPVTSHTHLSPRLRAEMYETSPCEVGTPAFSIQLPSAPQLEAGRIARSRSGRSRVLAI